MSIRTFQIFFSKEDLPIINPLPNFFVPQYRGQNKACPDCPEKAKRPTRCYLYMVKIRLKRIGARNHPVYRVVAADSRSPRDGKFIEELGTYHPSRTTNNVELKLDRIDHWISCGAQPSETVASFIKQARKAAAQEEAPANA